RVSRSHVALWLAALLFSGQGVAAEGATVALDKQLFAVVGGERVTHEQFHTFLAAAARKRFYHGKVSQEQMTLFRREAAQQLVDTILLRQEAERRGIVVSNDELAAKLAEYEKHASASGGDDRVNWERALSQQLREQLLLSKLRQQVLAAVDDPDTTAIERYYQDHRDKFTRPEQVRVSLILLSVPPYAPSSEWQEAVAKAQTLLQQLHAGAAFAQLARDHSQHESAVRGGDLGFVHQGMLSADVQKVVDALVPGSVVKEPLVILQGVAIVRLEERQQAEPVVFAQARERAASLLQKERESSAWEGVLAGLRKATAVQLAPLTP
ncbi:MAG: PpiC-type peptidyl-prolyl cis-trans isomerase, partial [Halothiobacillaceae bacterium]